ncbi:MAG: hypothetical protein ABWX59_08750 [Microbacteriaceae bacterium]
MSELGWVLLALATIIFAEVVAVVVIVRMLFKRIRASRALGGAVLRTRARFSLGAHQKVLKLRVRLRETLDSGQAAIDLAGHTDGPHGDVPRLFRRIHSAGETLEQQLRLMESEKDAAVLAEELPVASRRVDEVAGLVRRLRSAVATGLDGVTDDNLTTLRFDVDREVAALHAGAQELHALNGNDVLPESQPQLLTDHVKRGNHS